LKVDPQVAVAALVICAWSCSRAENPPSSPARQPQVRSDASGSAPADSVALADRYVADADRLAREARYADARASFARAAEIYRAGRQWGRYVHCLNGMGEQSRRLARLDEATGYIDKALKAGLEHLGERDLEVASTYACRADVLSDRGDFGQAIRWHTRALDLRLALLGTQHAEVAASYAGRASAHRNEGEFKEALADCDRALTIQLATLGERHPDVAWTYNILGTIHSEKGEYEDAFAAYSKALAILRGATGDDAIRLAKVLSNLGSHYDVRGDYDRALASYQEALSLQTRVLGEHHPQLAGTYSNMGVVYDSKGDYGRALSFYERAVAIYLATGRGEHPSIGGTYGNMGLVYFARKDYEHAITFIKKARSVFSSTLGESHPRTALPYDNLGNVYNEMGDHDQAIACHEKALAIKIRSHAAATNLAVSYNNLGAAYAAKGDYDRAVTLYGKALAMTLRALGPRHPDVASIYRNLGSLYDRRGNVALAVANHRKALAIYRSNFGDHHPGVAQSSNDLGEVYRRQGHGREALTLFETAIRANRVSPSEGSTPGTVRGGDALSETVLLESLSGKARVLADGGGGRAGRDLRAAVSTYVEASGILDRIRRGYRAEGSKLLLAEQAAGLYDRAIAAALELYRATGEPRHLEIAFRFAEKSRNGILLDALAQAEAERFAGIPDTLLSEERALRIDLAFYERARSEEELRGKQADAAKLALWQDKVFGLKRAYDSLLERLEREYPDYYKLQYNAGTPSLADVQEGIPDDRTALVEYFTGADQVFIFVVSKQGSVVKAAIKGPLFEQQVQELRQGIVDRDFSRYVGAARRLYDVVLAPIGAEVAGKSLIIVPDGSLGTVPFEALLTKAVPEQGSGGYSALPYVLEEHGVAYAYSATLLLQKLRARGRRAPRDFVGFAPVFAEGPPAGTAGASRPLPATREEVTSILEHVLGSQGLLER
jgi:tetratricopeptide (TPR) repeat protein